MFYIYVHILTCKFQYYGVGVIKPKSIQIVLHVGTSAVLLQNNRSFEPLCTRLHI